MRHRRKNGIRRKYRNVEGSARRKRYKKNGNLKIKTCGSRLNVREKESRREKRTVAALGSYDRRGKY